MVNRIAILADYAEENWPSMDLCASRLLANLSADLHGELIQPPMQRRVSAVPILGRKGQIHIADRLLNRQWDYPRYVRRSIANHFDFYHIVDHSYAHLALETPSDRTGIYCHDIDAFLCLVDPESEPRPRWFRAMCRRILRGLQSASIVFHNSQQTRRELLQFGLVQEKRLVHAPLGVAEEFTPLSEVHQADLNSIANRDLRNALTLLNRGPWLLHVGSSIPRKRVDILLRVFAEARSRLPNLRLLKVGGTWGPDHQAIIDDMQLQSSIIHLLGLNRTDLAECYRRATAVLVPSQSEGFGLPVIEAMACGSPVIASDIPVLRESGGTGAVFAPFGEIDAWVGAVVQVVSQDATLPNRAMRLDWASRFSWAAHARIIVEAYQKLLSLD